MKNAKMQCIALDDDNVNRIYCPFCGTQIGRGAEEEPAGEWIVGECKHLLFAATDEGFECRSERFDKAVEAALSKKTDAEREEIGDDINELVELVEIRDAFMFQSILMGPPAGLRLRFFSHLLRSNSGRFVGARKRERAASYGRTRAAGHCHRVGGEHQGQRFRGLDAP